MHERTLEIISSLVERCPYIENIPYAKNTKNNPNGKLKKSTRTQNKMKQQTVEIIKPTPNMNL